MGWMLASHRPHRAAGKHTASYSAHMSPHPINVFVPMLEVSYGEQQEWRHHA
jgi:hypothetical protein